MEKLTSPDETAATQGRSPALAVVAALIGALLFTFLAGYLTLQLQLAGLHLFIIFDTRTVSVAGDWLPYLWQLSLVILVLAAVVVYRLIIRGTAARLVLLATLALIALLGTPVASGPPDAEQPYPLFTAIVWAGAKSSVIPALIGAGVADLIAGRPKTRAH